MFAGTQRLTGAYLAAAGVIRARAAEITGVAGAHTACGAGLIVSAVCVCGAGRIALASAHTLQDGQAGVRILTAVRGELWGAAGQEYSEISEKI